jgi:hypothetical protein
VVTAASESLPSDLASAHAMIVAERAARITAQAELSEHGPRRPTRKRI